MHEKSFHHSGQVKYGFDDLRVSQGFLGNNKKAQYSKQKYNTSNRLNKILQNSQKPIAMKD